MKSKKLLAALVAIPASVVMVGEVQAAEAAALDITIKNDFLNAGSTSEQTVAVENLHPNLSKQIFKQLKSLNTKQVIIELNVPSLPSDVSGLQYAKNEVEKTFKYLKTNINGKTTVDGTPIDNQLLYGLFSQVKVKGTEASPTEVSLELSFEFLTEATYETSLVAPAYNNILSTNPNIAGSTTVMKIKAVNDYIAKKAQNNSTNHNLSGLELGTGLSAHSYAIWTYLLLKKFGIDDVNYIYGMSKGKVSSWNAVKIGAEWYPLDVANNDISNGIHYRYFLTDDEQTGLREIYYGIDPSLKFGSYDVFTNIVNPVYTSDKEKLFYVDEKNGGEIYVIDNFPNVSPITRATLIGTGHTSQHGKVQVPGSTNMYFVNTSNGNYLYQYKIDTGAVELVIQENIESFSFSPPSMTYKVKNEIGTKTINTSSGISAGLVEYVSKFITNTEIKSGEQINQEYKNKVIEARRLFNVLTASQQSAVTAKIQVPLEGSNVNWLLHLENSIKSPDSAEVNKVIDLIKVININNNNYFTTVEAARYAYNLIGEVSERAKVYNYKILTSAEDLINDMSILEGEILAFAIANDDPSKRDSNFYSKLTSLINQYENLHPTLKRADFNAKYQVLLGLGNSANFIKDVEAVRDTLNILNEDAQNYLDLVKNLEVNFTKLSTAQKGVLTQAEINDIQRHFTTVVKLNATVNEIIGYLTDIKSINNTADPVEPEPLNSDFINKIKRAKNLLDSGIKPSQWKAIEVKSKEIDNDFNRNQIIEKVTGFIARVTLAEDGLLLKIDDVKSILLALDTEIKTNLSSYIMDDYKDKVVETEIKLLELVDNKQSDLNILLSLMSINNNDEYNTWRNYQTIKKDLESDSASKVALYTTEVNKFLPDETTKELPAIATETAVNKLLAEIESLHAIYQHFLKAKMEELNTVKETLENDKYSELADIFIIDISRLQLNNALKLEEIKPFWDEYKVKSEESVIFKDKVEQHPAFIKLKTLWDKLEGERLSGEELAKKIAALIKEINDLSNTSTKAELEAVKIKCDALSEENRKKITNYNRLEKLLADIIAKEKDEADKAASAANKAAAEKVIEMIQVLNNESTSAEIKAARAAYEALTEEAKKLVNDRVLQNLVYFESLLATQTEQAEKEAKTVMDRISRIDKTKYTEAQIKSIRMAYNALSDLAKSLVTNLHLLIDAENHVIYQHTVVKQAKLDANAFDLHMDTVTRNSSTAEIAKARSLYNNLSAEAKRHVTTLEKLVRLETMWNDPQYIELVYTYYPDYVHAVKPGAIVIEKPKHDPLYIPDDSTSTRLPSSVATSTPKTATWSPYDTMTYKNGQYTTQITASQVKNIADRNMRLKAGEIEIVIPTAEIQSSSATVGVSLSLMNNQLNIQFTEGNNTKYFSSYVEILVPISTLKGNASQIIERVTATGSSPASFKVDGSNFIIRTTSGGTFKATTVDIRYTDIQNNAQGNAIRELAKRGIIFNTTNRLVQSHKQINKLDIMTMIASALDLSSNSKSKYMDLENTQHLKHAQGLLEAGIISGATSSRFNPTAAVTKQEAAIIIANMYRYLNQDLSKVYNELTSNYRDIANLTLEARQSIAILELFGVVDGTGAFNPTQTLSRGEFAELFYKALSVIDYL